MFYSGNILRTKIFVNVSKNSDPDVGLRHTCPLRVFKRHLGKICSFVKGMFSKNVN